MKRLPIPTEFPATEKNRTVEHWRYLETSLSNFFNSNFFYSMYCQISEIPSHWGKKTHFIVKVKVTLFRKHSENAYMLMTKIAMSLWFFPLVRTTNNVTNRIRDFRQNRQNRFKTILQLPGVGSQHDYKSTAWFLFGEDYLMSLHQDRYTLDRTLATLQIQISLFFEDA